MRSQRAEDDTTKVSLFPFLAVLLCTMGALIVLLIVIARQARVAAAQPAPTSEVSQQQGDDERRAALVQTNEQLEARRQKVSEELSDKQKHLASIEDRGRKLEAELIRLQAKYEKAVQLSRADTHQREQAAADLLRLKAAVAEAKKVLDSLEKDVGNKRPSYSIIPYQGSRKTKRRPIYIECRADEVILHPEGIVLREEDFLVPDDTSNPLASALRATREYLAEQSRSTPREDPYPLILVRPGGTESYDAVRRAMKGWGPEFGYELIDDDWEMEYPAADPILARTQYRAIQEARARQTAIIARMRNKMQRRSYVPAPGRGRLIEEGGGEPSGGRHRFGQMGTAGSHAGGSGRETQPPGDRSPRQGSDPGTGGPGTGGPGTGSSEQLASSGHLGSRNSGSQNSGSRGSGERRSGERNSGNRESGHENHNHGNHSKTDPMGRKREVSNKPGGKPGGRSQTAGGGGPSAQRGASGGGAQTGGSGGGPGGESGAAPSSLSGGSPTGSQSLASKRGKNWGIRRSMRSSIGITRPVRVSLYNDRLVIRSDETSRRGKVITLGPDARETIDAFVEATWQQTKSWGIAGKGMYWKPILSFQVEPGGENRFKELSALLQDSGLEVRRAKPSSQSLRNRPLR